MTYIRDGKPQTYQPTLILKLQGDKLTGTLSRRHNQQDFQTALENVKIEAGEISFMVRMPTSGNGPDFVRKFHGKIAGDTMKGAVEGGWAGPGPGLHSPLGGQAPRRGGWSQLRPGTRKNGWSQAAQRQQLANQPSLIGLFLAEEEGPFAEKTGSHENYFELFLVFFDF